MAEPENQAEREAYYAKIDKTDLSPLWTTTLVPARPKDFVRSVPHLWDFDNELCPLLTEAGGNTLFHAQLAHVDHRDGRIDSVVVCTEAGLLLAVYVGYLAWRSGIALGG